MKSFNNYLIESKNTHMEHIEDMIFNDGVQGARLAISSLQQLRDMLAGNASKSVNITVKWDGAPSIFAGVDPSDGEFFVAKKGIFNKNPQLFKTPGDIDRDLSGELADKFRIALREFRKLGIKSGVFQGDLMFTEGDFSTETYGGKQFLTFQPNTIVYAVEKGTKLARQIEKAKIGVVWHTTYTGNSLENMKASFGKEIVPKLKDVSSVWMDDANYKDVSGSASFTKEETKEITGHLSTAGKLFRQLPSEFINMIASDNDIKQITKQFLNTYVRAGVPFPQPRKMSSDMLKYVNQYFDKQMAKYSTEKGKSGVRVKKDKLMKVLGRPSELQSLFEFFNEIVAAKIMVVNKLHKAEGLGTFLRTTNGLKVTDREGYVAIDKLKGGAVKLVDRLEFSKANFSSDVIKGWQK